MTASLMAINGRIQREGEVVHLVAQRLFDFSSDLASVGDRDGGLGDFPLPHGRGDQVKHGGGPDPRGNPKPAVQARDIYVPLCRIRHKADVAEIPHPQGQSTRRGHR